jgi:hypothetical protein
MMWPFGKNKKKVVIDKTTSEDFKADLAQLLIFKGMEPDDAVKMSNEMMKCANKKLLKEVY